MSPNKIKRSIYILATSYRLYRWFIIIFARHHKTHPKTSSQNLWHLMGFQVSRPRFALLLVLVDDVFGQPVTSVAGRLGSWVRWKQRWGMYWGLSNYSWRTMGYHGVYIYIYIYTYTVYMYIYIWLDICFSGRCGPWLCLGWFLIGPYYFRFFFRATLGNISRTFRWTFHCFSAFGSIWWLFCFSLFVLLFSVFCFSGCLFFRFSVFSCCAAFVILWFSVFLFLCFFSRFFASMFYPVSMLFCFSGSFVSLFFLVLFLIY